MSASRSDGSEPRLALSVQLHTEVGLGGSESRASSLRPDARARARLHAPARPAVPATSRSSLSGRHSPAPRTSAFSASSSAASRSGQRLGFVAHERAQPLDLSDGLLDRLRAQQLRRDDAPVDARRFIGPPPAGCASLMSSRTTGGLMPPRPAPSTPSSGSRSCATRARSKLPSYRALTDSRVHVGADVATGLVARTCMAQARRCRASSPASTRQHATQQPCRRSVGRSRSTARRTRCRPALGGTRACRRPRRRCYADGQVRRERLSARRGAWLANATSNTRGEITCASQHGSGGSPGCMRVRRTLIVVRWSDRRRRPAARE